MEDREGHWRSVYRSKPADAASWFQPHAETSLALIEATGAGPDTPLVDVGGGASPLAGDLIARGWTDLTVLDIAGSGLDLARAALGDRAEAVTWIVADVTAWRPERPFGLWHDRAVFHFLTEPDQRAQYRQALDAGLAPGGWLVMGAFGPQGPERCSGLPVRRWSADELAEELGPAFALRRASEELHRTPGGAAQSFTWTLFERLG